MHHRLRRTCGAMAAMTTSSSSSAATGGRRLFAATGAAASVVGRWAVKFPHDVSVAVEPVPQTLLASTPPAATSMVKVKGPLGELSLPLHPFVRIDLSDAAPSTPSEPSSSGTPSAEPDASGRQSLRVRVDDPKLKNQRAMWGTTRALINNMVTGVSEGFTLPIRLVGVGYRASLEQAQDDSPQSSQQKNRTVLSMRLGFSHPVVMDIPQDVQVSVPTPQRIILQGPDLHRVTQFAASIRKWRKPEPYNQKGIFVGDETIKKKEGKKR